MDLDVETMLSKAKNSTKEIENLKKDLECALKRAEKNYNYIDLSEKYSDYWNERLEILEYDVASTIGLSRLKADNLFECGNTSLTDAINESILEVAEENGVTLYKLGYKSSNNTYDVKIYEDDKSEIKSDEIEGKSIFKRYEGKDLIFEYNDRGKVIIRDDLKEEIIKKACEKCMKYKEKQDEENEEFKAEGELYNCFEGEGYIFLENEEGDRVEDIDFVCNDFKGEGYYKVIDKKYVKVDDEIYEEGFEK